MVLQKARKSKEESFASPHCLTFWNHARVWLGYFSGRPRRNWYSGQVILCLRRALLWVVSPALPDASSIPPPVLTTKNVPRHRPQSPGRQPHLRTADLADLKSVIEGILAIHKNAVRYWCDAGNNGFITQNLKLVADEVFNILWCLLPVCGLAPGSWPG